MRMGIKQTIAAATAAIGARTRSLLRHVSSLIDRWRGVETGAETGNKKLLVLIHGWLRTARSMKPIKAKLPEGFDVYCPECHILWPWSVTDVNKAVTRIVAEIDKRVAAKQYDEIVLAGYSCGALIAQGIFCRAHGAQSVPTGNGSLVDPAKESSWREKITRVVLIAGVNRGWTLTSAASWDKRLFTSPLENMALLFEKFGIRLLVRQIRRGSPFVTTQRLQWLEIARTLHAAKKMPLVVQLLGTRDDLVAPSDCVDILVGKDFHYIEVPYSSHWQIVKVKNKKYGQKRMHLIRMAITADPKDIKDIALRPQDADDLFDLSEGTYDLPPALPNENIEKVVLLVHGIRDEGFWTKKVGIRIKRLAKDSDKIRVASPSYGFFGMGPFFMPRLRFKFVDWLRDQYVTIRALYPKAKISCVAHSNGTYLLMRALKECSAMHFDRVVLAGSVVRRNYDIAAILPRQVAHIRNYVSSNDCVVATFPRLFEFIPIQDLGSAGVGGFHHPKEINSEYIRGSHGAALHEDRWEEIANFVLGDDSTAKPLVRHRTPLAFALWFLSPLVWLGLIGSVLALAYELVLVTNGSVSAGVIAACAAVALYVYFVSFVLKSI